MKTNISLLRLPLIFYNQNELTVKKSFKSELNRLFFKPSFK